jgi:hypothetical protein
MFGNNLDIVFFVLAVVFAGFTIREYRRDKENLSASGRTWRRIAVIFFLMSLYLFYIHRFAPG